MCCANTTSTENAKKKAQVDPTSREEYGSHAWRSELLRGMADTYSVLRDPRPHLGLMDRAAERRFLSRGLG